MSEDPVSKSAEAVSELAKLGQECVKFIAQVTGETGEQAMGVFADWLKFLRAKQQINFNRVLLYAQQEAEARQIEPGRVPPRLLKPIVEEASLEEDDDMARRWAALLVSASVSDVPPSFPGILRELSPEDARLLESTFRETRFSSWGDQSADWVERYQLMPPAVLGNINRSRARRERFQLTVDNLIRLGLVEAPVKLDQRALRDFIHVQREDESYGGVADLGGINERDYSKIRLTVLGIAFLQACTPAKSEPAR